MATTPIEISLLGPNRKPLVFVESSLQGGYVEPSTRWDETQRILKIVIAPHPSTNGFLEVHVNGQVIGPSQPIPEEIVRRPLGYTLSSTRKKLEVTFELPIRPPIMGEQQVSDVYIRVSNGEGSPGKEAFVTHKIMIRYQ